ncbi:MAG: HNH endonuclease signature motif containing protein, partial [Actinomycetota bacterium]
LNDEGFSARYVESGEAVPASELARLAARADFFGAVFSAEGDPLWMGRSVRLATDAQWRAWIARDGGCVVCDARPSQCEAHHLIPWERQGPTDIDNLVLICRHHHHVVHDAGWRLRRGSDGWTLAPP